ncbi:MAG: DUF3179 domain-containing protein [Pirellulales bacterium]
MRWAGGLLGVVAVAALSIALYWHALHPTYLAQNVPARRVPPEQTFDLERLLLPRDRVLSGGVPKDGIPALTNPPLVPAAQAEYLQPGDRVIGVVIQGEAQAYPVMVLTRHEVVNERIGGMPVAVTYCPLCDSVALFDRRTELGEREFGVSGLLYNSNVLIYDRGGKSEGLWSQLLAGGVSGPGSGTPLKPLPVELTTWADWTERYPETKTLAASDAEGRAFRNNPYRRYFASPDLMFPVQPIDKRLPLKERVLGVWTASAARAYPLSALAKLREPLAQEIDGRKFTLVYNQKAQSVRVTDADEGLHWMYSFWFGWYAFHRDTQLFTAADAARAARRP